MDTTCLVVGEVTVLRHFHIVHGKVSGNAVNYGGHIYFVQLDGGFRNNVAHAVADEDFNSDAGIFCFLVCQVNERTGDSVCHLIRVARIYFFKHDGYLPIEIFRNLGIIEMGRCLLLPDPPDQGSARTAANEKERTKGRRVHMSNFLTEITELFRYAKTYKLSTVTLKTPIIDFSFAPSTIPQPS